MKENKYVITYVKEGNNVVIKEVEETLEDLKERIEFYNNKGYAIVSVRKEKIIITYEDIDINNL